MSNKTQDTIKKTKLFPGYSYLPLAMAVAMQMLVYFGTKPFTRDLPHLSIPLPFEGSIPFAPEWVTVYAMTFFFWIIGLIVAMEQERELCFKLFTAVYAAQLMCFVFFIAMPTCIDRPEITGSAYYDRLLSQIYAADEPVNLFPSMHCMLSYIVFRGLMYCPGVKKPYVAAAGVLTALICASTVLVKQHFLLDVFAGLILGELSLCIALKTSVWKFMEFFQRKLLQTKR